MLNDWKATEGTQEQRPEEIDKTSSPTTVYVRKNIKRQLATAQDGSKYYVWKYEEMEVPAADFWQYEELLEQLETPAMQSLKEENAALMLGMADLYEQLQTVKDDNAATMAGIAEIYETILTKGV